MKRRSRLTRARLRELLHYNPKTGQFHWWTRTGNRTWLGPLAGCVSRDGYRYIKVDHRIYREHQLAWFYMNGRWGRPLIDHRDGDGTNNRWTNLRQATRSQNCANCRRPRDNTSGYKGVHHYRRSGKWTAQICSNRKRFHLGTFETREEAREAYLKAARKLFGEFARPE